MEARAISNDSVSKLVPGASHSLAHLSDSELLTNTRHLAGKSNQVFAALLQRQRGCGTLRTDDAKPPRQRGRHIPASERRTVFERDGGRCTYVDERGQRCPETHLLQLHHLRAFAKGGPSTAENLALRCAAHNALAAEEAFGRAHVVRKRDSRRHAPNARSD